MTILIGNFSLSAAVLVALIAVLASVAAARLESLSILRGARWLVAGVFALLTLASAALLAAEVQSDFRLAYVARYTERALPFGYKLAAFWAGQEGSLLLWAWLLATMSAIASFTIRKVKSITESAGILAALSAVLVFFAALMLFAANPFVVSDVVPADGHGLNPMLQDPAMILHPPLLFLGYAGYTIPFAILIGALIVGRRDSQWLDTVRIWSLVAWVFLTVGIILGAKWAYVELGWGGYWAWDPVENASLLPWLTGTALLHSLMVQQHRGMFKKWNASLIAGTFALCIFGTYITRSGVIDSVHSFGKSLIGTFFLAFLITSIVFSVILLIARRKQLAPEHQLDGLVGKEGFFLATNVLLLGMTAITLIGTIFPVISSVLAGQKVTVAPSFYNKVVAPLGLLLVALMAVGPLLTYGHQAAQRLVRGAIAPAILAAVATIVAIVLKLTSVWALITVFIAAFAGFTVAIDLVRAVIARMQLTGENLFVTLLRQFDNNHRRYGAQTAHIGVMMVVVGIVGSSLFELKEAYPLTVGQSADFHGRQITLAELKMVEAANYSALQATVSITQKNGETVTLHPQIRQYAKWEELNREVAISSNWREDVYVTFAAFDPGKDLVTLQAIINPAVSWIWTGSILLTLGAVLAMLPRVIPQPAPVDVEAQAKTRRPVRIPLEVTT